MVVCDPGRWGLLPSGIYVGMMRLENVTTGQMMRAAANGAFGLVMLWGALGSRH